MKKFEVSKMFPSLCISNVSKVVGCERDVLRPRVQSLSVGCLVILSSCPRVLSTRTLGSCPAFWQLFPQRAGIYSLKLRLLRSDCENIDSSLESLMWIPEFHLPFRIPPLLSATSRFFTCFPSISSLLPALYPSTSISHLNFPVLTGNHARVTWLSLLDLLFIYVFIQQIFPDLKCMPAGAF